MTVPQRHITAGDVTPVTIKTESTYGSPTGTSILYGDVAEGGNITLKDTPNPYLSWRYGSRSFNPDNYVTQQNDAAFSASLEVRDVAGWKQIIEYATGAGGTTNEALLDSRTAEIYVKTGATEWKGRAYNGCKTDKLTISADAPGGIVKFEEEVMAKRSSTSTITAAISAWTDTHRAVQWMNGVTLNGADIYPQSFKLTITNNLERNREMNALGATTLTGALLEGRREMELEMDVWMVDLTEINNNISNATVTGNIEIILGLANRVKLTLSGLKYMADGNNTPIIQDKQRQTIRFRVSAMTVATVV